MLDIFEILGPVMVGPSSSHTAGAVRIGLMARTLLGGTPKQAHIALHGSFAETGLGHGTDRALIAGLLGMRPDDLRIPHSFSIAREQGMEFDFREVQLKEAHPNTAVLELTGPEGERLKLQASSVGGGRIHADYLDDIAVDFTGDFNTLIIHSVDISGELAEVTGILSDGGINIANMSVFRSRRGGKVLMVIETDQCVPLPIRTRLSGLEHVQGLSYYEREDTSGV